VARQPLRVEAAVVPIGGEPQGTSPLWLLNLTGAPIKYWLVSDGPLDTVHISPGTLTVPID
jgi:hypothetical protein